MLNCFQSNLIWNIFKSPFFTILGQFFQEITERFHLFLNYFLQLVKDQ